MTVNVAQKMLDILSDASAWTKRKYVSLDETRRCLVGARLLAAGMSVEELYSLPPTDLRAILQDDPYMRLLVGIIREQFPDRVLDVFGVEMSVVIDLAAHFNDISEFTDIRVVLEKAAAEWDEQEKER